MIGSFTEAVDNGHHGWIDAEVWGPSSVLRTGVQKIDNRCPGCSEVIEDGVSTCASCIISIQIAV